MSSCVRLNLILLTSLGQSPFFTEDRAFLGFASALDHDLGLTKGWGKKQKKLDGMAMHEDYMS